MYDDDALCYTFANDDDGERDVSYSRHDGGRGGRGGRGRPRGPRRGRGGWVGSDQDSSLRRYSSSDNLSSRRGDREGMSESGFRDRGRGRGGRWRGRDHSYDGSRGRWGQGERGGGRGYGGGGGGRGGRSGRGGGRPRHFPLRQIVAIEDIDEITMRLTSQLEEFEVFMLSDFMSEEDTTNALKILSRVVQNDIQRESVLKVLQVVCTSRFLDYHLVSLIQNLASSLLAFGSQNKVIETVEFIHQLLSKVCLKLPSYSSKCYLLLTLLQSMNIIPVIAGKRRNLAESVKELDEECQRCMKMMQDTAQKKDTGTRFNRGPNEDDDIPPDDFSQLPIFPSVRDMDCTEKIFLRANKEEGAFRDVSHYLDVQFRLLREDYIRPLRKGIKEFKELRDRGEVFRKSQDLRLYQKVQIISMVCKDSLEHRVQFEMSHQLKRVRWQSSKRLLYGSLVCLTMDDFETLFFAVVTNRDAKDLEKGIVQIRFESGLSEILELSSRDTFTMAETTAYFEAYRHVLEGLREMKDALPMARYLVDCNPTIKPPQYLLSATGTGQMNLSSLRRKNSRWDASAVTIINPQRWPPPEETTLNESQMEAVRTALSKELAIIQGPPGTGKTYVGLKVAKVLLENREVWTDPEVGSRPILVVCYTNHALDQFLEGILDFCPTGIVRVGSRCKNPQLEEFNLKNIRRKMRTDRKVSLSVRNSIRDCARSLSAVKEKIDGVSAKLEATTKGVVGAPVLQHYMLPGQYESLMRNLYSSSAIPVNRNMIMMEWLSNGLITQAGGKEEEDGEDPYAMLAKEVTSQILQGQGTCQEGTIDPNGIHFLSPIVRAQLYRSWLQKAKALLQKDATLESLKWQQAAKREILPDSILQRVISGPIYSAISYQARQQEEQQTQFCVRAWLGVSEGSSPEAIIQGKETRDEAYFTPRDVISLPRKTRIQLYRFWREKAILLLEKQRRQNPQLPAVRRNLAMAHREILPDEILQNVVNPRLLEAIKNDLLQRLKRQSEYLIRAWLGIQEFCQNARDLERLLDQLESGEETKAEDEQLNVVEEADFIQNERQLDLDDNDDLFDFGKKKSGGDVRSAMQELGVQTASTARSEAGGADDDGFSVPKYNQKKQARKLQALLTSSKPMTQEEAQRVSNLWSQQLAVENRIRLYLFWLRKYQDSLRQSVKEHADTYNTDSQQLRELRLGEDKDILVEGTVIGMTTTGAARYRRVLAAVACPIIILEEAAEVMEAHVVTTLHKKCQHLILIGDHQQLRPSPTVYELCRHYKLDLSLFERLVNNNLPHSTLAVQHRMRPDVARLVRHVYPKLKDHGTTLGRPHIRGVKQDVFLFHHVEEETRNDETSSKSNQHEAELCVRLCRYLLQQGYPPDTVTILTAYSGQVFALKNIMKKEQTFYQGVRVTAVDNYQGEENDVIILSLVRSNQEGSVGFLGTDNRVCVALSRARNGFYAFGNFKILADSSELWKNICRTAKEHGQLGDTLVLQCENHPDQQIEITTAKDFAKMPEGGCKLPCGTRLDMCGHVCELSCHGYDRKHEKYKCRKKCERRPCKLGHPCTKKCYEDCGECLYKVEKTVPMCGHVATMECKRDPHTWDCKERCNGKLPCGHQCSGSCGDCRKRNSHVVKCKEEVERVWPCGHLVKSACDAPVGEWPCSKPCGATLDCKHVCKGTCGTCWSGRVHVACKEKCGRALPGCGHKCRLPCGTECLPCQEKSCGTSCRHSSCKQPCGTPCPPCNEACPWKSCRHRKCDALCHQPCPPCAQPCGKKLKCGPQDPTEGQGHSCSGLCGEKCFCFTCDRKNFVPLVISGVLTERESVAVGDDTKLIKLPLCGHIFNVAVLDVYVKRKCQSLPPGGSLTCPVATCNKMILEADCWRYHRLLRERHDSFQKVKQELITTTTISRGRLQKLLDSLALLTHDAEQEKSFASKAARGQILKDDIDVNKAFALTNQIKLARVFEKTNGVLQRVSTSVTKKDAKDAEVLQKLLYKPMTHLTAQRLRELRLATRRFVDSSKLTLAQRFSNTESYFEPITAILDAPSEQDLCDVGKTTKGATGVSISASPRRSPTLPRQQHPASTCQTTTSSPREATSLATSHRLGTSATAESRHNSSVTSTGPLEGMAGARSSLLLGEKVSPHLSQSAESDAQQATCHLKDALEKKMDPPRPASQSTVADRVRALTAGRLVGASASVLLPSRLALERQKEPEVESTIPREASIGQESETANAKKERRMQDMSLEDIMERIRSRRRSRDAE